MTTNDEKEMGTFLTGNVHLDRQITTVTTLLMISRDADHFKELFAIRFPKLFELEDFE